MHEHSSGAVGYSTFDGVLPWRSVRRAARELLPLATAEKDLLWVRSAWALLPVSLNPKAGLASDKAQSLIALVSLALLCESCRWVQDDFADPACPLDPRWTPKTGHQWTPENRRRITPPPT